MFVVLFRDHPFPAVRCLIQVYRDRPCGTLSTPERAALPSSTQLRSPPPPGPPAPMSSSPSPAPPRSPQPTVSPPSSPHLWPGRRRAAIFSGLTSRAASSFTYTLPPRNPSLARSRWLVRGGRRSHRLPELRSPSIPRIRGSSQLAQALVRKGAMLRSSTHRCYGGR